MKLRRPWLVRFAQYLLRFKLTPLGRTAFAILVISSIGLVTVETPAYQVFSGAVMFCLVVETVGLVFRPRLKVHGYLPDKTIAGETITGTVSIENVGWLPAFDLMCGFFSLPKGLRHLDASTVLPVLRPGERGRLPVTIQAAIRGEYALPPLHVHSTFPLNLLRFGSARMPLRSLSVIPAYHRLEQFNVPISERYQPGGELIETRSGNAPEYVGNRDYIPGEPARRLDFRAWARVGKPVVREFQDEFCSRVALVLDTYSPQHFPLIRMRASRGIEAAISLTASIADSLNQTETAIDLFAAGPDLFLFRTSSGTTHFESVLEILAAIEPTSHHPFEKLSPVIAESLESTSVVLCIFVEWDDAREELTRRIRESGCGLRALLVRSMPSVKPFPDDEFHMLVTPDEILSGQLRML